MKLIAFIPEEYWTIEGQFEKGKKAFEALYYGTDKEKVKLTNEEASERNIK